MGAPSKELEKRMPFFREENQLDEPDDIGSTFVSGFYDSIEPKTVAAAESSGNGYSYFVSGEKYLVVPNGGYNSIVSAQPTLSYSAGEMRKTFYQGGQYPDGDEDLTQYALTEYRSYD